MFFEQDEIIPHLEPGRLPSTVDPDATDVADKGKKLPQRQVRISAWKLAKLDSNEAIKAAAKARASSSVLRPISSRHHTYDTDHLSSSNVSGRSSPASTNQGGFLSRNFKAGTSKSSYPPSRASRDGSEMCGQSQTPSNFGSPRVSNLTPSSMQHSISNIEHFNPIYQSSADQSPLSASRSQAFHENVGPLPISRNPGGVENSRASVFWDPEAGRFVSSTSSSRGGGSSQAPGAELVYTGQSIFFGGPIVNDQPTRGGTRTANPLGMSLDRGAMSSHYQQNRAQQGGQLPVFVPSDGQQKQFSSRFS